MKDIFITREAFARPALAIDPIQLSHFLAGIYKAKRNYNTTQNAYQRQIKLLMQEFQRLFDGQRYASGKQVVEAMQTQFLVDKEKKPYKGRKYLLEFSLFLLKQLNFNKQRVAVHRFGEQCLARKTDMMIPVLDTLFELSRRENIQWWLADARRSYFRSWQKQRFGNLSQVHWSLMALSRRCEWAAFSLHGIPNFELSGNGEGLTDTVKQDLQVRFEREFSREKIIEVVSANFNRLLAPYKDKELSLAELADFKQIMAPFLEKDIIAFEFPKDVPHFKVDNELWDNLSVWCEVLLIKEGVLRNKKDMRQAGETWAILIRDIIENQNENKAAALLRSQFSTVEKLAEILVFLPSELAIKMVNLLTLTSTLYLGTEPGEAHRFVALLYQLPSKTALAFLRGTRESTLKDFKAALGWDLMAALKRDGHPLVKDTRQCVNWRANYFLDEHILKPLQKEMSRLGPCRVEEDSRYHVLSAACFELRNLKDDFWAEENELSIQEIQARVEPIIRQQLLANPLLDKYEGWGKKLGLMLLNTLMALPLLLPAAVKFFVTGTFFFSLTGKSMEVAQEAQRKIDEAPDYTADRAADYYGKAMS